MHEEYYFGAYEAASAGRAVGAEISACKLSAPLAREAPRGRERGPRVTQQAILMRVTLHFHLKFS